MIIDTHTHIGTILDYDMHLEQLLRSMTAHFIDFSLVSNIEAVETDPQGNPLPPELTKPQNQLLRETLDTVRPHADKLGVLPWMRVYCEMPDAEFRSILEQNRRLIYGLKLHPFHSRTAPDDPCMEPVYRLAAEYDLPIVSHTGGCKEAMSPRLYNAAKHHPELNFVMVHMDLGTDNATALDMLGKLPNLYGDTTWVPIHTTVEAIRRYGSKKMLFGTDNPIDGDNTLLSNPSGCRSLYQEYFHELRNMISPEAYDDLMYKNAQRIFKL